MDDMLSRSTSSWPIPTKDEAVEVVSLFEVVLLVVSWTASSLGLEMSCKMMKKFHGDGW
jgi:hypothetical protein